MVAYERDSGFRLSANGTVTSLYKQKIDAMFDDTRSVTSHGTYGNNVKNSLTKKNAKLNSPKSKRTPLFRKDDKYATNTVQDRIEKMFSDMTVDTRGPLGDIIGIHTFQVDYLGSTPLSHKVTSLSGLQQPLKELYFAYRKNIKNKNLTGQLEISKSGLKVRYQSDKGDLELLNPFPTIAVWSAVKFVLQATEIDNNSINYAFLPLITDPENIDKQTLFNTLNVADKKYILNQSDNPHSPIFAVVMRKIGVSKQLECHSFVCRNSEDAIIIAATLYKSLMSHMNQANITESERKLKNRNGVSCASVASSAPKDIPVRPPRKKRSTSSMSCDSDIGCKTTSSSGSNRCKTKNRPRTRKGMNEPLPPPPPPPAELKPRNETQKDVGRNSDGSVRSHVSEKVQLFSEMERRKSIQRPPDLPPPVPAKPADMELVKEPLRRKQSSNDSGDILTKVAIPRSGSFLNAGGLTRYKSIGHRNNGKKSGGSPLGFNELFNEFKIQENLHSMDEILNAIIDSEGMSFNDLKPIYKEFLLKLAVTLTKDEIFQHSKAIMKRQRKKILRKNSTVQNKRRKMFKGANGLRMVFRKPFGKNPKPKEQRNDKKKTYEFKNFTENIKIKTESSTSNSSYDLRQFCPKELELQPPKRLSVRKRNFKRSDKVIHITKPSCRPNERTSTSEDSDFLTTSGRRVACPIRNSSSGYVSYSECESESCVNRCYCSLKVDSKAKCYCSAADIKKCTNIRPSQKKNGDCISRSSRCYDTNCDLSWCECDSDTCNESNKCYCKTKYKTRRQSLKLTNKNTYISPPFAQYSERMRKAFDDCYYEQTNTKNAFRMRSNSVMGYPKGYFERQSMYTSRKSYSTENMALDCEFLVHNKGKDSAHRRNMKRLTVRSTGGEDALSVKKSAEMAALFADVRLSQRTDVRNMLATNCTALNMFTSKNGLYTSSFKKTTNTGRVLSRNASLEDTLGYLP